MALRADCPINNGNTAIEMLGRLILEELKCIRKDMKEEIRQLRQTMLENPSKLNADVLLEAGLSKGSHRLLDDAGKKDLSNNSGIITVCEQIEMKQELSETLCENNVVQLTGHEIPASSTDMKQTDNLYSTKNQVERQISNAKPIQENVRDSQTNIFDILVHKPRKNIAKNNKNKRSVDIGEPKPSTFQHLAFTKMPRKETSNNRQRIQTTNLPYQTDNSTEISDGIIRRNLQQIVDFVIPERSQNSEKLYKCKFCWKLFSTYGSLCRHSKTHTGERPFLCNVCGKTFKNGGGLKVHVRIHTGEKPYKCDQCGRCFNISGNLAKHRKVHASKKTHICRVCNASFMEVIHLQKHYNEVHLLKTQLM